MNTSAFDFFFEHAGHGRYPLRESVTSITEQTAYGASRCASSE